MASKKLLDAVHDGDLDTVKRLINQGADVNYGNWIGCTALHEACQRGDSDIVKCLVENNADINLGNRNLYRTSLNIKRRLSPNHSTPHTNNDAPRQKLGNTALHYACERGDLDIVKCLVENNADINLGDKFGNTALHYACERGDLDIVKCLVENNADINLGDKSSSPVLHRACTYGHGNVVNYLLENNADINMVNFDGNTALYCACQYGYPVIVKCLVENNADINLGNKFGNTALHYSLYHNRLDNARILVNAGAITNIKNENGESAEDIAKRKNLREFFEWKDNQQLPDHIPQDEDVIPDEILHMDRKSVEIYKQALRKGKESDYTIRLMVVGPQGVGKTTLINRLLNLGLDPAKIESTNSIDVHVRRSAVNVHSGQWILNKDDVEKLTNHDVRLGKVLTSLMKSDKKVADSECSLKLSTEKEATPPEKEATPPEKRKRSNSSRKRSNSSRKRSNSSRKKATPPEKEATPLEKEATPPETAAKATGQHELKGDMVYEATSETQNFDVDVESKEEFCKIIEAMKRGNSEETCGLISVWDFGGDFIFYTTHQTFLSTRGIYLVVVDITKTLFDEFKDNDCFVDSSGLKYLKMGEYIVFWLNSIHTYAGNNQDGVPPVILVATHLDKIQGDKVSKKEELFDKVRNCLMENGMSLYDHLDDDDFGVDNTKSADDPDLKRLRQKIFEVAKAQKSWGEEKPASWIAFEKILIDKQNNGIKMLSFEEVKELSKGLESGVMDHDQLDVFLKFQHAIGNLIYFSDLNEYVVLDPKWLIHAFRCIITDEKFEKMMPHAIRAKWREFSKTAELKREVIDVLWNDIDENHREHLLGLMEKLDIIAKPMIYKGSKDASSNHELDYYLVPPMLKQRIADDQLHFIEEKARITPNMYFVFPNHYISPSVFHRLIAACMKKWKIAHQGNEKLLFCGCGIFTIDESQTTTIMICMENYRIKFRVLYYLDQNDSILPDDVSKAVDIRNFVEETLKNIFGKYQQNIPYKLHIECSPSGGGLIAVDDLKKFPKFRCTHDKIGHLVSSRELLTYWFNPEEYQNLLAIEDGKEKTLNDLPFGFSDRRPSEKQLMDIAKCIGADFVQLAINLDFKTHEIQTIEHDYPNDLLRQCFEMLVRWKRKFGKGTLGILHKIMYDVGCNTQGFSSACMRMDISDH